MKCFLSDTEIKEIEHDLRKGYKELFLANRRRNISNGKRNMGVLFNEGQGSEKRQVPGHSLIHT